MSDKINLSSSIDDSPKVFVAILMACFGDIILCNSLFQNIKKIYPNSKTIFVVNKPWVDAAKYQPGVDEVIAFDKRGKHKGPLGLISFVREFPYKKIDYLFKIYKNERVDVLSWLLRPSKIIGKPYDDSVTVQERHNNLLKKVTAAEIVNYPILYNADDNIPVALRGVISQKERYVALCPCSSRVEKDIPVNIAAQLINKLNCNNYKIILVGAGKTAANYANELVQNGCDFIDLVNKTTIYELAQVLRNCDALISVDTGTMHFGYANGVSTVGIFAEKDNIKHWAPVKNLYPHTEVVPFPCSVEEIYNAALSFMNKKEQVVQV